MNKKQNQAILDYVKRHSPPEFADQIRTRSQKAMDALKKQIKGRRKFQFIYIGCPHCDICRTCLWTKAWGKVTKSLRNIVPSECCTDIKFCGIDWHKATHVVTFSPGYVTIHDRSTDKDKKILRQNAFQFLTGHIAWANEEGWGKEYKGKKKGV